MTVLYRKIYVLGLGLLVFCLNACSVDNDVVREPETGESSNQEEESETGETTCNDPLNFVFNEADGIVRVDFENASFTADWKLKEDGASFTGEGYMVWEGPQHLSNPGNGTVTFKIKIKNPGSYQFLWFSAVKTGTSGTDHNDTWLRFNDATDYYGQNDDGTSIVYPKDTGKTPNPEGASKDGWFKIYRSGNDLDFKWQSSTFDNNAHNVFVDFDTQGTYIMEVSARSSGHGIDKFVLFNDSVLKSDAITSTEFSVISCD